MANRVVSIEVGIWHTKVSVTAGQKKNPQVYQAFVFRTPEGVIEDGYIRDKEVFAGHLNQELQKHNIKERNVIFTLSSSKIITREITVPLAKDDKVASIVQTQAKEYFPMDITNYSITHTKMDVVEENGKKEQKLLLVAVPDNLLNNYYSFAEAAGLQVEAFDYIGNSTVQFMLNKVPASGGIVVEVDEQATVISILSEGKLVFQRIAPYGYGTTLSNMMNHPVLGLKDEYAAFDFLQRNNVIHYEPIPDKFPNTMGLDLDRKKELLEDAYVDIRESLNYHIRVVFTAVEYYQNQMSGNLKGNLYLIGSGTKIAGLSKMFEQEIPLSLYSSGYETLLGLDSSSIGGDAVAADFISTVGSVVKPLNLKPKDMKEKESSKSSLKTAYMIFGGVAVVSLALVLGSGVRYFAAVSKQHELEQDIENMSYIEKVFEENAQVNAEHQVLAEFEQNTITNNDQLGALIVQLEEELPRTMTVESLSVDENKISLNVACDVKMTAAAFLVHMQNITTLTNVAIPSMAETEDAAGNKVWKFSVLADYVGVSSTTAGDATVSETTSDDAVANE